MTRSLFKWTRRSTTERLGSLLEADGLTITERTVIERALQLYREHPRLDFADAYLVAAALEMGPAVVVSRNASLDTAEGVQPISA